MVSFIVGSLAAEGGSLSYNREYFYQRQISFFLINHFLKIIRCFTFRHDYHLPVFVFSKFEVNKISKFLLPLIHENSQENRPVRTHKTSTISNIFTWHVALYIISYIILSLVPHAKVFPADSAKSCFRSRARYSQKSLCKQFARAPLNINRNAR